MKIIFMGTPDFSAIVLEKLNSVFPISAVVTGFDKPVGRGYQLKPSPLKLKAIELGIEVLQFEKVSRDGLDKISSLNPDVVVTAAFGQILSEKFLSIPRLGVLNIHASLLPKYRGASPIQCAILNSETETGITIMKTVKAVDAGDILLQKTVQIDEKETAGELFLRLALLGGDAIVEGIAQLENGTALFVPQDGSKSTHCTMISKSDGKIDFSKTFETLSCFVRGMSPWPSAYAILNGKTLKIYDVTKVEPATLITSFSNGVTKVDADNFLTSSLDEFTKVGAGNFFTSSSNEFTKADSENFSILSFEIGEVVIADTKNGLVIACGDGFIRLKSIQLEGSKRMLDTDFLLGRSINKGYKFQ